VSQVAGEDVADVTAVAGKISEDAVAHVTIGRKAVAVSAKAAVAHVAV
jgi:hypothetical protein